MSDLDTEARSSRRLWIFAGLGALALHLGQITLLEWYSCPEFVPQDIGRHDRILNRVVDAELLCHVPPESRAARGGLSLRQQQPEDLGRAQGSHGQGRADGAIHPAG